MRCHPHRFSGSQSHRSTAKIGKPCVLPQKRQHPDSKVATSPDGVIQMQLRIRFDCSEPCVVKRYAIRTRLFLKCFRKSQHRGKSDAIVKTLLGINLRIRNKPEFDRKEHELDKLNLWKSRNPHGCRHILPDTYRTLCLDL